MVDLVGPPESRAGSNKESLLSRIGRGLVSFTTGVPQIELDRKNAANELIRQQGRRVGGEADLIENQLSNQGTYRELLRVAMGDDPEASQDAVNKLIETNPDLGIKMRETLNVRDDRDLQRKAAEASDLLLLPPEQRGAAIQRMMQDASIGIENEMLASLTTMHPKEQDLVLRGVKGYGLTEQQRMGADDPSAVREFQFYESLGDPNNPDVETEAQKRYRQVKRATGRITDVAGVPTIVDTGSGDQQQLSTQDAELDALRAQTEAETEAGGGGLNLTEGQKKVDAAFAPDFVAWQAQGGFADVQKNVSQLSDVQKRLEKGEKLTGTLIGNQPRAILATTNPEALDALEQVEEVIQRNLRLILGAQFTEKEGVRLIARAYNPRLEPELNAKRLARLTKSLTAAAKAKNEAAKYFTTNGTLAGWGGTMPSISGIENELDNSETPQERLQRLRAEVEELERGE